MVSGREAALVCADCRAAFSPKKPHLCKYALANNLYLGRIDARLWSINVTHEMCLALARTVATKVVLRSGGVSATRSRAFHQSGYVGSDAKHALDSLPPKTLNDALAVTFCGPLSGDGDLGREFIGKVEALTLRWNS